MKNTILATLILLIISGSVFAKNDLGLGVIVGEPTGISMKIWSSKGTAIDFGVAWSLGNNNSLHIHGDYLIHKFNLIKVDKGRMPLYYGIGGRIRLNNDNDNNDDDNIGVRFPIGLSYLFGNDPFDIFVEIVPILDLAPKTELDFNGAIGFRYWF